MKRFGIHDAADVVHDNVVEHLDAAGARVDRDMRDGGAVGVGRFRIVELAVGGQAGQVRRRHPAAIGRHRDPILQRDEFSRDAQPFAGCRAHVLDERVRR